VKVLLVGTGGREHALARALIRTSDPAIPTDLVVQAGNPGMDGLGEAVPFDAADPAAVAAVGRRQAVDLVVVGPEAPLVAGVADAVRAAGIPCFGPSRAAAQLEASKSFAKDVMAHAGVPTARSRTCRDLAEVDSALAEFGAPHVVKDDALAAGKGVVVTSDADAARAHAAKCLARPDGAVVIEDYLDGPEVSLFCLCDGTRAVPLVPAQDFKRLADGNAGPNTGGMGAYSPLPWLPARLTDEVVRTVAEPTLEEMRHRGTPFQGLLYCGLALTSRGLCVVEFNVRFGDPETQVVLERLESPLADLLLAAATGALGAAEAPRWSEDAAVTVVMAAPGYPDAPRTGRRIRGLAEARALPGVHVLQAGTARAGDDLVTAGGRVLDVVGRGRTLPEARAAAYSGVNRLRFDGGDQHRTDIATWDPDLMEGLAGATGAHFTTPAHPLP
jgi:phosphoribosylamine--glycine ligase